MKKYGVAVLCVLAALVVSHVFAATAVVYPLGKNEVKGLVLLSEENGKLRITGEISGLKPGALHGFHLHELGDCSVSDGSGVGGHFNPGGHHHAGPEDEMRHFGDFGNIRADQNGVARIDVTVALSEDEHLAMAYGRAVIVHAGVDDQKTNPAGNAGPRIGCGVVGISK